MVHLYLRCMGTLALSTDRTVGPASTQARRLALLAVLAVASERETSRDALLALLWPERDEARSRGALSQAMYALRHDLEADALFLGHRDLRLNPDLIASDVGDFQRALARGDDEAAVACYVGDFLDGVHISHTEQFEQWADGHRQRLRALNLAALERLSVGASARANYDASLAWALRLAEGDPLSHRAALRCAEAHAAVGDRAAALRHIRQHEERVQQELDVGLDGALLALRSALEQPTAPPGRTARMAAPETRTIGSNGSNAAARAALHTTHQSAEEPVGRTSLVESDDDSTVRASNRAPTNDLQPIAEGPRQHLRRWRTTAIGSLALVTIVLLALSLRATGSPVGEPRRALVVAPFEFAGVPDQAFKARVIEELLRANFASIPGATVADSAGSMRTPSQTDTLRGTVVATPGGAAVEVVLLLQTPGTDVPEQLRAASGTGDLTDLADALTRQVIARRAGPDASAALLATASVTTHSLEALRAFAEGEERSSTGRWKEAADAYSLAVSIDSTFALASYRLSEAANWNGDGVTQIAAAGRAWRMRAGLSQRERLLVEAYWAWNLGDADGAERGFRDAVSKYPFDAEGWYQLGEVVFHTGPVMGRPAQLARGPYERVVALASEGRRARRIEAYLHLTRIAGLAGDLVAFDSLLRILRPIAASTDLQELNTLAACVTGDRAAMTALKGEQSSANGVVLLSNARRCAVFGSSLARAIAVYAEAPRSALDATSAVAARIEEAALRAAVGQPGRALALLSGDAPAGGGEPLVLHRALLAWSIDETPVPTLRALRDSLDLGYPRRLPEGIAELDLRFGGVGPGFVPFVAGLLDATLDDREALARHVRQLRVPVSDLAVGVAGRNLAHTILAHDALRRGQPAAALAQLDSLAGVPVSTQLEYFLYRAPERLVRARALLQLRRFAEAATVAQSVGQRSPYEYTFVPAATRIAHAALTAAGHPVAATALVTRQVKRGVVVGALSDVK